MFDYDMRPLFGCLFFAGLAIGVILTALIVYFW